MKQNLVIFILLCLIQYVKVELSENNLYLTNDEFENNAGNDISNLNQNLHLKSFYDTKGILCEINAEKLETLSKTVDNYIQRYISLFLKMSNLLMFVPIASDSLPDWSFLIVDYKVQDLKEEVKVDLEVTIAGEDLLFLQDYFKTHSDESSIKDLSKLNEIMSKIMKLKKKSFLKTTVKAVFNAAIETFIKFLSHSDISHILPLLVSALAFWIIYYFSFSKRFYILLCLVLNSLIFREGIILYKKRLKEVDLEIYYRTLKFKEIPDYCDPKKATWYHSINNYFFGDDCLQYFKNTIKTPEEEVSFFQCLIDSYALYLFETPFRIFGSSFRKFAVEISGHLPFPINLIFYGPVTTLIVCLSALFILILCGKRLKLSFFGSSFELGDSKVSERLPSPTTSQVLKAVRESKKLRPWTKSRFPRRLESDFIRRRKLILKGLKPSLPYENGDSVIS